MRASMRARQLGLSPWQWLLVIAIAGLLLTVAAKLGPVYITNFAVQSTVKSLAQEPELVSKSIQDMRLSIERKFDTNRILVIQAVCRLKELPCMKVEKSKTMLKIDANYETRVHVLGNVDAVVVFSNNYVEIPIPGGA